MNRIIIDGDQARLYGTPKAIPQGQSQFSQVQFSFSEEWDNLRKIAQFEQRGNAYNVEVSDDRCFCPSELVKGVVNVRVKGCPVDTTSAVIATANEVVLPVSAGFQSGGTPPVPPTPDLYQKLIGEFSDKVQPDLNQNDPSAKDYVKNRTHYVSTEQKVIVPKQTFTGTQQTVPAGQIFVGQLEGVDNTLVQYMIDNSVPINVLYDGIEYTTESFTEVTPFGMIISFGNKDLDVGSGDTGVPFVVRIILDNTKPECIVACLVDGEHTIEVTGKNFVHTIDTKYLPLSIKSPPHQIMFSSEYGVDVDDNSQIVVGVKDEPPSSPREQVLYNKSDNSLCLMGKYAKFVDTKERVYKINSQLETQTIKGMFDKAPTGLIKLSVVDIVDYRQYSILLYVDYSRSSVDGRITYICVQNLAWINGHLFAFSIRDVAYNGDLKNGNMEVKRIL